MCYKEECAAVNERETNKHFHQIASALECPRKNSLGLLYYHNTHQTRGTADKQQSKLPFKAM